VVSVVLASTSSPFLLSLFLFFSLALYSIRQEIEIFELDYYSSSAVTITKKIERRVARYRVSEYRLGENEK
jgi:hypothetical protein